MNPKYLVLPAILLAAIFTFAQNDEFGKYALFEKTAKRAEAAEPVDVAEPAPAAGGGGGDDADNGSGCGIIPTQESFLEASLLLLATVLGVLLFSMIVRRES